MKKGKAIYYLSGAIDRTSQIISEKYIIDNRFEKKVKYDEREYYCFEDSNGNYQELLVHLCYTNLDEVFKEMRNIFNGKPTPSPYMW